MARIRGLQCCWRENGHRHSNDPQVFYLYIISYNGLSIDRVFFRGILDEY